LHTPHVIGSDLGLSGEGASLEATTLLESQGEGLSSDLLPGFRLPLARLFAG